MTNDASPDPLLPPHVRRLFWEHGRQRLRVRADASLVIGRVLRNGDWDSVRWLRATYGDMAIATFLADRRGAGLSARLLRYWQLVLGLRAKDVDDWLAQPAARLWAGRAGG